MSSRLDVRNNLIEYRTCRSSNEARVAIRRAAFGSNRVVVQQDTAVLRNQPSDTDDVMSRKPMRLRAHHSNGSRIGFAQANEMIQQCRLSCAITTHQRNNFTCPELQIDAAECSDGPVRSLKPVGYRNDLTDHARSSSKRRQFNFGESLTQWARKAAGISHRKRKRRPTG